jgi:two-component system sensor histidine kinase KdpD
LEGVPPALLTYRGVTLREFDLDAALKRRPQLLLVDELAHTNVEGCRHARRWQDVQELLDAGIDVWTTLNVQHLESLNDVVAQITGVIVRETVPDAVLDRADEIELVDVTPEELTERLRAGKVYLPPQAERALRHFFQKTNLVALRELALRQAANRLRRDVDAARSERAAAAPWATNERLLVCVGESPTSAKLVRSARRMAAAFGADWIAAAVAAPGVDARAATDHLRLAEQLGAETHTLVGEDVASTLLDYARSRNVTKIVVGKTAVPWHRRLLRRTVVDRLLEQSGDIDVYVIKGEAETPRAPAAAPPAPFAWRRYLATAGLVALCGLAGWACTALHLAEANVAMVFLVGVVFAAARLGRGPAVAAAIANVLVFDFFFVTPYFSFSVSDAQYLFTFAVMLGIGLLISALTARVREQLSASRRQEQRTAALYRLTRQLSEVAGTEFLARTAGRQLAELFGGEAVLYLSDPKGPAVLRAGEETATARHPVNALVAQWVAEHGQTAGAGTDTLPNATALFVPLVGSQQTVGALGVRSDDPGRFLDPEQRRLLETCASLVALAIERDRSVLEAHEARLRAQAEEVRSALLSSVSHDLRTPLAAIAGAASALLDASPGPDEPARGELLQSIADEARRLGRLVDNLLDMSRLDSGAVALDRQWHVLEELIGSARSRLRRVLPDHPIRIEVPADLPLLFVDGVLVEQLLVNLLENAAAYTPPGTPIEVSARVQEGRAELRVADEGPGLPPGTEERVFDKFYRGAPAPDGRRGVGLGLAICRAIAAAHGGVIRAANRPGGGAEFIVTLPRSEAPPSVPREEPVVPPGA